MISGMETMGMLPEARFEAKALPLKREETMKEQEREIYAALIRQHGHAKNLSELKRVHANIVRSGHKLEGILGNLFVQMYGKCGSPCDARAVFNGIPHKNCFSWTLMISACLQSGLDRECLELYHCMDQEGIKPDYVTFLSILGACSALGALPEGKLVHERLVALGLEAHVVVATALLSMYSRCQRLDDSRRIFDRMRERNLVTWNAMISAYTHNGHGKEALDLYNQLKSQGLKPDSVTFTRVLSACLYLGSLTDCRGIHADIAANGFDSDVVVGSALINTYGKLGSVNDARSVFDKIQRRDVVFWSSMIAAYAQNGHGREALELYRNRSGMQPNNITFVSLLDACSFMGDLREGMEIHAHIAAAGYDSDAIVENALVNMYAKCGSVQESRKLFDELRRKTIVSWNAMISAYAQNGHVKEALVVFEEMNLEGAKANDITLMGILFACTHEGLLQQGWQYFVFMEEDHRIKASVKHYMLMIDLLGRTGHLDEAEELIENMPFEADAMTWTAFLSACKVHRNTERAERIAERAFELDPKFDAPYILLSGIYAAEGRWGDAAKVRKRMEDAGAKKKAGYSFCWS